MAKVLIINSAEPGICEFTDPLEKIVEEGGHSAKTIEYIHSGNTDLNKFDGIIISGSPQGDDIVEHHKPYFTWIKTFEKPVFGICAGHHITGSLYHSKLLRNEEPESGDYTVEIVKDDPIFYGLKKTIQVKQMHNDSVTLPENFELLATAKTCKNQLMKHIKKPLYTSQFHPEYYNHSLIKNFLNLCNKKGGSR